MAAPTPPSPEWLPSGFPPRSFPPGDPAPRAGAAVAGRRGARRRGPWLAAAAVLVAVLLLVGGLFVASRDDGDGPQVAAGTSTSAPDTSVPAFDPSTTAPATVVSIDPVSTTSLAVTSTSAAAPGVLEPSVTTLAVPRADATSSPTRATLAVRNTGATAVAYTTQSSSPGLTAAPARATIAPGASTTVTVTVDASRIPGDGPFAGTLSFAGTGGTKTVQVQSVTGRPPEITDDAGEACAPPSGDCSRQIQVADNPSVPTPTPCNSPWIYSVSVADQSRIQAVRALARRGIANGDAPLQRAGSTAVFQSAPFGPLPSGIVLRFSLEAVDEHGFARRLPEQTINC